MNLSLEDIVISVGLLIGVVWYAFTADFDNEDKP